MRPSRQETEKEAEEARVPPASLQAAGRQLGPAFDSSLTCCKRTDERLLLLLQLSSRLLQESVEEGRTTAKATSREMNERERQREEWQGQQARRRGKGRSNKGASHLDKLVLSIHFTLIDVRRSEQTRKAEEQRGKERGRGGGGEEGRRRGGEEGRRRGGEEGRRRGGEDDT
eukprot:216257-Hanusia_phi.AAC.1